MKHLTLTIIFLIVLVSYINTTSKTVIAEENHSIYPIPVGLSGIAVEPHISQESHQWLVMYFNQCEQMNLTRC